MMSSVATEGKLQQAVSLQGVDPETCMIVFKNHWAQVVKILEKHDPLKNTQAKYGSIPPDEASAVQNYVEHMLFLLIEEQANDAAMGPILEFVVCENIMEKLFLWSLRREFTDETKLEQLKMYEMLVTQSHQPLLHHKPILKPLMMLLSSCSGTTTPNVEGKLVVLLNQLCSILAKDPSILELFFHTSEDQGAANFLIFSLLIPFIHREGAVGQQARDALLFIMSLSAENTVVAHHIVENTYFCPVLATGLSGLYSSLPTKLEEKGEEWHCLLKDDWLLLPPLVQFMNSLEFCNAVIQVAHPLIRNQLVNYIYNGFLVPVLAPALHKVTVEEVMTTTAYLDLFLRSISEPALLQIFLRFILLHQHENVHILDTLTSRINTPFRLCVVSLALFRTLIGLHCEDVMLQLILRYLIPCNHMMLSQRWAVKERDCYSVSAAKLLALTPVCCSSGITLTLGHQERDYILWSQCTPESTGPSEEPPPPACGPAACIVEYGRALDISYLQYLWEAHTSIVRCERACRVWSARYDGDSPPPPQEPPAHPAPRPAHSKDKGHTELEWDDSYDTGMTPAAAAEPPEPPAPPAPAEPPKHIQEMKKSALLLFRGPYIEEADFQDDVMVYRLCAQKDAQDRAAPPSPTSDNGPLPSPRPEADPGEGDQSDRSDLSPEQAQEPRQESGSDGAPGWDTELAAPISEAESQIAPTAVNPEGHGTAQRPMAMNPEGHGTAQRPMAMNPEGHGTAQRPMAMNPEGHGTAQRPMAMNPEGHGTAQCPMTMNPEGHGTAQCSMDMSTEGDGTAQRSMAMNTEGHSTAQRPMAMNPDGDGTAQRSMAMSTEGDGTAQHSMDMNTEGDGTAQHPTAMSTEGDSTAQHPMAVSTEGDSTAQRAMAMNPEGDGTAQNPMAVSPEGDLIAQRAMAMNTEEEDLIAQHPTAPPDRDDLIAQYDQIIRELDSVPEGLTEASFSSAEPSMLTAGLGEMRGERAAEEEEGRKVLEEEEDDFDSLIAVPPTPQESLQSPFGVRDAATHQPPRTQNTPFTGPFISVVLSKLENMLENSLHVNLLLIGIITQLASYPQPLLRSFLLNTSMVFQPSVRSLYQVLASVKNKIEQFASVERDFPGLLIQAQQYLLFRVDMSDLTPESLTKDSIQEASRAGSAKNLLDGPPKVLQPFLSHRAKVAGAPPSLPLPVRNPMLAAALFPEFLKELAALAQEHSLLCHTLPGCEDACC